MELVSPRSDIRPYESFGEEVEQPKCGCPSAISVLDSFPALQKYLRRSWTQILIVSFICFGSAGNFNALSSIGAGLPSWDESTNADSNAMLMWIFALSSICAPSILAAVGLRNTLIWGASGYIVYVWTIYNYTIHVDNESTPPTVPRSCQFIFLIFSCWLGVCAGVLWTAQGAIIMSYPTEHKKGAAIATFWFIFNFGAMFGSLWGFGVNFHSDSSGSSPGTFIGFMFIMRSVGQPQSQ
jgi:hypothetical protein